MAEQLKILLAASEVAPLAKTGGLADVAGSLPKALAALGHDVRVVMPRYRQITGSRYAVDLPVEMDGHLETAIVREAELPGRARGQEQAVPVYLIDNYKFFYREGLYGFPDDASRFDFFCKAVLSILPRLEFQPDVIHCNDWQTALIPLFLKVKYEHIPFYQDIATVFTIHNLQYQGRFPREVLRILALSEKYFTPEQLEFYGQVNYMKSGLLYADLLNTVSKKYALEIQTPELGEGLDGLLRKRAGDLHGILNGLDYEEMNPTSDPRLVARYDAEHPEGKKANKHALQREMDLPEKEVPLIGIITRLVDQKGLDLISAVIDRLMQEEVQFVLLGSGEDRYQQLFSSLKLRYRQKMGVKIGFDADLAQRIYAGSDIFLMPSRFEPCGLGQLISLRYGTIPVVRATGGLEDTISDYHREAGRGNGFSFASYRPEALWETIERALKVYRTSPEEWRELVQRAMRSDFSWGASASQYVNLYRRAIKMRRAVEARVG